MHIIEHLAENIITNNHKVNTQVTNYYDCSLPNVHFDTYLCIVTCSVYRTKCTFIRLSYTILKLLKLFVLYMLMGHNGLLLNKISHIVYFPVMKRSRDGRKPMMQQTCNKTFFLLFLKLGN